MTKEKLTLPNIRRDLLAETEKVTFVRDQKLLCLVIPVTAIALIVGILTKKAWIGLAIFALAVYPLVLYVKSCIRHRDEKRAIREAAERGDVSVSVERLASIRRETQDPLYYSFSCHPSGHGVRRETIVFNFESGAEWQLPLYKMYYEWSRELSFRSRGLEEISAPGDEFFRIVLQGHPDAVCYYPCRFFTLGDGLELKS